MALIECVDFLQGLLFGEPATDDPNQLDSRFSGWSVLLVPIFGGIVISVLLRFIPGQRFHGIPDVMEASALPVSYTHLTLPTKA